MAPKGRRRTYGNSHIAGHARVQLGDRQVTRNIKIEQAYIQLQNELELPDLDALVQAFRIGASQTQPQLQNTSFGPTTLSLPENVRVKELGAVDGREGNSRGADAITISDAEREFPTRIFNVKRTVRSDESQTPQNNASRSAVIATNARGLPSKQPSCLRDSYEGESVPFDSQAWFSKVLSWSRLPNGVKVPMFQPGRPTETADVQQCECGSRLVASNTQASPTNDMPMLLTAVLSYVVGRNLSFKDISDLLIMCQERQFLGLLACVISMGLYKYFMMRHLIVTPSCPEKLILEDAYGRIKPFSPDICVDFDILTRFLEIHYRDTSGTTAGALVTAGQFHLMLGSRRGKVFSRRDWGDLVLKPGSKLVNSVYIRKDSAECLNCHITMTVTPSGEFHCTSCRAYHRDCDTIDPPVRVVTTPSATNTIATTTKFLPPSSTSSEPKPASANVTECDDTSGDPPPEIAYNTSGLINLDFKLQPLQRRKTTLLDRARVKFTLPGGQTHLRVWRGDFVTVLLKNETADFSANQWWYLCENDLGRQGYVPRTYLDIIEGSGVRILTTKWSQVVARQAELDKIGLNIPTSGGSKGVLPCKDPACVRRFVNKSELTVHLELRHHGADYPSRSFV